MKNIGVFVRLVIIHAALAGTLSLVSCANNSSDAFATNHREPIGPAPMGLPNAGIGAPGGASEDTRTIGSVAESEGEATGGPPAVGLGSTSSPIR